MIRNGVISVNRYNPFKDKKIPVISIHSLAQETFPILHSRDDNLSAVHENVYYTSYKLIAFYLALLDLKVLAGQA